MRRLWKATATAASAIGLLGASPSPKNEALPPYVQAYEPRTVDERGQWMQADEYERQLRDSALVIRDDALNGYVRRVLCNTVGEGRCKSVRIYLLRFPAFQATMTANGTMTVFSGLLLRARNEAELGSVLGHEFAHFELRHGLQQYKKERAASDAMMWTGLIGLYAGVDTSVLQASLLSSTFAFSREQEQAADLLSLKYLSTSLYPSTAAADVWQHLMAEHDATLIGRGRKPRQQYSSGVFDSHPTALERATYLRKEAQKIADSGDPVAEGHRSAIAKHLSAFLSDQIKLNDYGGTEYLLAQLASRGGWTGELLFARAELYRQRGNPRDLTSAAQFYGEAISAGFVAAEARRGLGLSLLRSGQTGEGRKALAEYLQMSPDASDAKAISALLQD